MLRVVGISVLSFADTVQSLLVDYLRLTDPPLPISILKIGAAIGDGIVYAKPGMLDPTLIWEWRLIGATSKSYSRLKLCLAHSLAHLFILCDVCAQSMKISLRMKARPAPSQGIEFRLNRYGMLCRVCI